MHLVNSFLILWMRLPQDGVEDEHEDELPKGDVEEDADDEEEDGEYNEEDADADAEEGDFVVLFYV